MSTAMTDDRTLALDALRRVLADPTSRGTAVVTAAKRLLERHGGNDAPEWVAWLTPDERRTIGAAVWRAKRAHAAAREELDRKRAEAEQMFERSKATLTRTPSREASREDES